MKSRVGERGHLGILLSLLGVLLERKEPGVGSSSVVKPGIFHGVI